MLRFYLFEDAILAAQVGPDLSRVFQDESDCAVDFGQRTDRWISLEDRLRGTPSSKVVHYMVKAETKGGLKVVVVEDDPTFRLFLKQVLEKDLGHKVVGEATTGTDMVRVVLETEPDVVVFDIHLPHLNGLDALRRA